jgi:hypothetical protein
MSFLRPRLTWRRPFFGRLEDELHGAGQVGAQHGENFRRGHQDGGMGIVTARMHDAHLLTVPSGARLRREWKIDLLGHRQGIHVGAKSDDRSRLATLEDGDDARVRNLHAPRSRAS